MIQMNKQATEIPKRRRRVRHHVNPLQVGIDRVYPEDQEPLFQHVSGPLEVEFGCADAEFLFQRALVFPHCTYVGIEIRMELVHRVNRRAKKQKTPQVSAVLANLNADLPALFLPLQIDQIFVNFPDPWFKKGQQKRRVVTEDWADRMLSFLKPGGCLFFQSDIFDLALSAMAVFEQTKGLINTKGAWSFTKENPYQAKSLREIRVEEKGLPVWRILYQKMDDSTG